ncbi:unnamed protein product, partial [Staurois parvus]
PLAVLSNHLFERNSCVTLVWTELKNEHSHRSKLLHYNRVSKWQGRTDHLETLCMKCINQGGLTIWKLGHCPRARGQ